ncbi:hypothetical protein [Streptomyces mayteni]
MLIVDAVLETVDTADFSLWEVADVPPFRLLPLSGRMSPLEVGTALASLVAGGDHIRGLLAADKVIAQGGLRVRDTAVDVTVSPGCCCGLGDWRDWLDVVRGDTPWLGHDPTPRVELAAPVVRLWPDGGDSAEPPLGRPIEIPTGDVPGTLRTVQEELRGFLSLTRQWATRHAPALATELVAKLDADLAIGAPLPGGAQRL